MRILFILLICSFLGLSGCATQMDTQTMILLNQRLNNLEKAPRTPVEASPRGLEGSRNVNPYPNRLNDAQKDFVDYMLNYLADEEEPN